MRWRWLELLGLAALVACRTAHATEPPLVMLDVERCGSVEEKEVRRVLAAELGTRGADAVGKDVTKVTVSCEDTHVLIAVEDPLTQKALRRNFELALGDPHGRSRLVAVAATELVIASWTELDSNPHPRVKPAGPAADKAATQAAAVAARERLKQVEREEKDSGIPYEPTVRHWYDEDTPDERNFRMVATLSTRAFFNFKGRLSGGGVRLGEEHFRHVGWAVDALLEQGRIDTTDNRYDITTATTAGWLMLATRKGIFTGRAGAGLRAGIVSSTPENGGRATSTIAPWGWPLGVLSFTFALTRSLVIDVAGEVGYAVLPVEGQGATLTGAWYNAQLGIGFIPPTSKSDD